MVSVAVGSLLLATGDGDKDGCGGGCDGIGGGSDDGDGVDVVFV